MAVPWISYHIITIIHIGQIRSGLFLSLDRRKEMKAIKTMRTKEENDRIALDYLRSGMKPCEYANKIGIPHSTLCSLLSKRGIVGERAKQASPAESSGYMRTICDRFVENRKKDRTFPITPFCEQFGITTKKLYKWLRVLGYDRSEWVNTETNFYRCSDTLKKLEEECPLLNDIEQEAPKPSTPVRVIADPEEADKENEDDIRERVRFVIKAGNMSVRIYEDWSTDQLFNFAAGIASFAM